MPQLLFGMPVLPAWASPLPRSVVGAGWDGLGWGQEVFGMLGAAWGCLLEEDPSSFGGTKGSGSWRLFLILGLNENEKSQR